MSAKQLCFFHAIANCEVHKHIETKTAAEQVNDAVPVVPRYGIGNKDKDNGNGHITPHERVGRQMGCLVGIDDARGVVEKNGFAEEILNE